MFAEAKEAIKAVEAYNEDKGYNPPKINI